LGAAPVNQTLTCVENQNGNQVTVTFDLSCPAGGAAPAPVANLPTFGDGLQKWLVMALLALGLITLGRRFVRR
jgi:hypothetical protein